jgi:hypothetical protein
MIFSDVTSIDHRLAAGDREFSLISVLEHYLNTES